LSPIDKIVFQKQDIPLVGDMFGTYKCSDLETLVRTFIMTSRKSHLKFRHRRLWDNFHTRSSGCWWRTWRVAENILNKQSRTANKGWSSNVGIGQGPTIPRCKGPACYEMLHRAMEQAPMNLQAP